ncbi:MAG: cell wall hydrolase [Lachnospiraceae bacterium]
MWKKGMAVLFCVSTWLCLTGFAGLGTEEDDTLNSLMNQLTAEDVDRLLAEDKWDGMVMAKVDSSVSVRADATTDSAVIGRMFKGDAGEIVEQAEGWTMIQSGDVTGWVSDEYLAFGQEAEERAAADVPKVATVTAQTLKVRDEASTEAQVIDLIGMGETIEVGEEQDGWLEIIYSDGDVNYVSAEYVEVSYEYGEARTIEEVEAEEAARKAAEEKEKRTANLGAVSASADELTLLAALIQAEAGNQPYEGQVAVGAVVMNRVRSGAYPNSIQAVISAPGQFGPAANGQVAAILASGPNASCMQAAQAALNGETTVGALTHFRRAGGIDGLVIGNHVFY